MGLQSSEDTSASDWSLVGSAYLSQFESRLGCSAVKNPPTMQEMQETWGNPLEEGMAAHSSILAWKIPDWEAWQPTVNGVKESDMSEVAEHTCTGAQPPRASFPHVSVKNRNMWCLLRLRLRTGTFHFYPHFILQSKWRAKLKTSVGAKYTLPMEVWKVDGGRGINVCWIIYNHKHQIFI